MTATLPEVDAVEQPTRLPCEVAWCSRESGHDLPDETVHHMNGWEPFTVGPINGHLMLNRFLDPEENPEGRTSAQIELLECDARAEDLTAFAMWLLRKAAHLRNLDEPDAAPFIPTPTVPAIWQVYPCPEWCDWSHQNSDQPADRWHWGIERHVPLRLQPASEIRHDEYVPATVRALPRQHAHGGQPFVHLVSDDIGDRAFEFDMLPREAAELASALLDVVKEVEG